MADFKSVKISDESGNVMSSSQLGEERGLNTTILGNDGTKVQVGTDGRLHVTLAPPMDLSDSEEIRQSYTAAISGHAYEYHTYIIPSTKILLLSKLIIGGESSSKISLFYSASGVIDGNEVLIREYYINGETSEYDIYKTYTGDGTATIITKLQRLDKGKRNITFTYEGYLK